ncbi:hypothetical protein R5R35_009325 [Gryllus longicercus]|uniref:Uncharacterized protein n=1 Tax=Gryllus longicercus TaxID=2509291 RepID=A0AAN9W6T5_9ORTH
MSSNDPEDNLNSASLQLNIHKMMTKINVLNKNMVNIVEKMKKVDDKLISVSTALRDIEKESPLHNTLQK